MRDYLNKDEQLFCVTITACLNTIEKKIANKWYKNKNEKKYLKYCKTYMTKYLQEVYSRIGEEGFKNLESFNNKHSLKIFPNSSPELNRVTVDTDTMMDLIEYAVSDRCDVCTYVGDEIASCKLRHILVSAFVPVLNEREGCDYYVGV